MGKKVVTGHWWQRKDSRREAEYRVEDLRIGCNSVFLCVSGASLCEALVLRLLLLAAFLSYSSDTPLARIYYSVNKLPQNLAV